MTDPAAARLDERPRIRLPRVARWIKIVVVIGAVAGAGLGIAGGLLFSIIKQPSGSMWPTLQVGERLFADRGARQPTRGAVVVFRYPEHPDQSFVKRIVGLPGDVVAVTNGEVSINDWKIPRCVVGKTAYVDEGATGDSGAKHEGTLAVEYLGDASYLVFEDKATIGAPGDGNATSRSDAKRWVVAPGQYFVLGDNRNNSHDSRLWFGGAGGGVPFANTRGRLRGHEVPALPANAEGAEALAPALASCLANRPPQTTPPLAR
jgi:signal peptidase I